MLWILLNYGPERFTEVFVGDFNTPEVIWNFKMRKHLVDMVQQHLGDFPKRLWQNTCSKYEYCPIPGVSYKQLEDEIFCHNYYLSNLCDEVRFPDWPIAEPVEVLRSCLEEWKKEMKRDTVKEEDACDEARKVLGLKGGDGSSELRKSYRSLARKYHPDKNPAGRDMFEKIQAAYELLLPVVEKGGKIEAGDDEEDEETSSSSVDDGSAFGLVGGMTGLNAIGLLMKTQVILCKRHGEEIGEYKYPAYNLLMAVLKGGGGKKECLLLPRRAEFVRSGCELVYQTCLVSPLNAEELVLEGGISVLEELLAFYISTWKECEAQKDEKKVATRMVRLEIITHIVHTLSGVFWFESGRAGLLSLEDPTRLCENWRRCCDGTYWGDAPLVKKYALEGLANMAIATSAGDVTATIVRAINVHNFDLTDGDRRKYVRQAEALHEKCQADPSGQSILYKLGDWNFSAIVEAPIRMSDDKDLPTSATAKATDREHVRWRKGAVQCRRSLCC